MRGTANASFSATKCVSDASIKTQSKNARFAGTNPKIAILFDPIRPIPQAASSFNCQRAPLLPGLRRDGGSTRPFLSPVTRHIPSPLCQSIFTQVFTFCVPQRPSIGICQKPPKPVSVCHQMKVNAPLETPQKITLRWLFRVCLLFLFAALGLLAIFLIWRTNLWLRTNHSRARLQQAGYPVSLAEAAQKYYPEISSNQNAAVFFEQAFALLPGTNEPVIPMFPHYQSTNRAAFFSQKNSITKMC